VLARVSPGYPPLPGRLPTCYSPVRRSPAAEAAFAHDLHVLSTPPAFILSQDQTLQFRSFCRQIWLPDPSALVRNYTSLLKPHLKTRKPRSKTNTEAKPLTLLPLSSFQRTDAESRPAEAGLRIPSFLREAKCRAGWPGCQPLFGRPPRFVVRRDSEPWTRRRYSSLRARGLSRDVNLPPLPPLLRFAGLYNQRREVIIPPRPALVKLPRTQGGITGLQLPLFQARW
jgi:hypothetical protein